MKSIFRAFLLLLPFAAITLAQGEPQVKVIPLTLPANSNIGEIKGNISAGQTIPLRWAESSSVACFPGTRFEMFDGNHVFYRITLPAASAMTVTLKPEGNARLSLYGIRQGMAAGDQPLPPNIRSAISCEASYPLYANLPSGRRVANRDDGTRKFDFISVNSPYRILIGVAGAGKRTEGAYTLTVTIKPR